MKNFKTAKRICLFGPQGSGKGTQAEKLEAFLHLPHIAPGNIFRRAIAANNALGKQVQDYTDAGKLVPDEITNTLIAQRLQEMDCRNGYILDGYPRNKNQAEALDKISVLTYVILVEITDEEAVRRLSLRRVCTTCGRTYHKEFKPPAENELCDVCRKPLEHRKDDQEEAIKERLAIYHAETEPLFAGYRQKGIFFVVDGMASIEVVWQNLQKIIK